MTYFPPDDNEHHQGGHTVTVTLFGSTTLILLWRVYGGS
jgi:hypothetical protein